ncbi:MAG: hypothetical protein D5R97_05045 [Candidatus Syntrophonatronum acetioxidans]|uniref:Uncharacterized protein n=1 Tax=Candidatus Syntrophonatronum acetioxidans TaxID=1795816 RepID=A0A424YET7_9FIRM|nr:MAG: hypothetical protein D5R97_05045 [Candidatus Syntrophonatronum acetioxidans]
MNKICPLCNGMLDQKVTCHYCQVTLENWGVLDNYFDRYGPYLDHDFFSYPQEEERERELNNRHYCTHFMYCPHCQEGITRIITKRYI